MVEDMANVIIKKVAESYPHIAVPAAMMAKITSAKELPEEYEEMCRIKDMATGEERESIVYKKYYSYGIRVVNTNGVQLTKYPAIPNVKTRLQFKVGEAVTVVFLDGDMTPSIVG